MPLKVVSFATYLVSGGYKGADHNAGKFVKALKGEDVRGYATVPVLGQNLRLEQSNRASAADWFGQMAADLLHQAPSFPRPFVLVPVPSSKASVGSPTAGPTFDMATAVATAFGSQASVHDCLRWKQPIASARSGKGSRDPWVLWDALAPLGPIPNPTAPRVLIDDVYTSGGHLQACRMALQGASLKVPLAICGARTVYESQSHPFALKIDEIPAWPF